MGLGLETVKAGGQGRVRAHVSPDSNQAKDLLFHAT